MGPFRVGIDIGGTFTDLCVLDESSGEFFNLKVLTTPHDLAAAVMQTLETFLDRGPSPDDISLLFHASTTATNTLLEQQGAATWLVITEGFTGVYETPELSETRVGSYNYLAYPKPRLLAQPRHTVQVRERIDHRGGVLTPLDLTETRERLRAIAAGGAESVAVCLLFSFMNPDHERQVRALIEDLAPGVGVYLSSETLPQIREYPRLATTVANAYVAPVVVRYLEGLERALVARGLRHRLYVMLSTGGCMTTGIVKRVPVSMIESGPAAGALAAAYAGRLTGDPRIISFDMGGTTAKAGIIEGGEPQTVPRFQAGEWLLGIPSLDLVEIGSGGGSIAWIDPSGMLKVGPRSAGADPGPACYRRGGAQPTVTDADLVLGWLNPAYFAGGDIALDPEAAHRAVATVAGPLGLDVVRAADGIIQIVNSQMVEALRLVTVSRGEDPREFTLVAFGGAGPVHAAALAEELKVPRVLVPAAPGVFSAMGLLVSDLKRDHVQTHVSELMAEPAAAVQQRFEQLEGAARRELAEEGIPEDQITCERALDLRYAIQKYELPVPIAPGALSDADKPAWRSAFDDRHEHTFGTRAPDQRVEIVSYRVTARVALPRPAAPRHPEGPEDAAAALKGRRKAYFTAGGWQDTPVYDRALLDTGHRFDGPAIVEQPDCTTVVHPGQRVRVDPWRNLIIETAGGG